MLPWKETSVESERLRFIERVTAGEEPVTELCRQSGISRKTGYKLIHRYEAYGEDGLLDRSRAPHDHPNATPRELAKRIVEAKRAHPTWGPKKLIACQGLERPTGPETRRALARAFQEYGLPQVSRPTTARPSPASAWAASHPSPHGGSSSGSSPSASSRDTLNRTGVSSASTAPSRRRRRRRPGPIGDGSGEPSTTSGTATTTSGPTRPWDSDRRSGSTPPRSGPTLTPQLAGIRGRGHRAPSAPQRRDQVEGGQSLCERVSSGRAHRPRPARRAHLVHTVRTPPHRRPRRPRAADRQDLGTRVTYVPGLTVTHVPGRTEASCWGVTGDARLLVRQRQYRPYPPGCMRQALHSSGVIARPRTLTRGMTATS